MSVINTNVNALIAQNALNVNGRQLSSAMESLSTGKRINSAADDAAGLAISSKMTAQIRGLNQAVRNANDGISLVQTAEGALIEVTNMMQRMRELAVQSANDTNTTDDRNYLDLEFQQLKEEINRIGNNTQFNGMNILDGSFDDGSGTFVFQVGANAAQTISLAIGNFRSDESLAGTVATATTTAASSGAAQVSTVTLGGTYRAGDVISIQVADQFFDYTVTDTTAVSGIASSLNSQISGSTVSGSVTSTVSGEVLTLTSTASGVTFDYAASAGGVLGNIELRSITTQANSDSAISALDIALKVVNEARATMGATINRLSYAADNLTNVSQNASEARSRVLDTDYAEATTELARTQIIQQAATAMLAQANQQQQTVLSLLQ